MCLLVPPVELILWIGFPAFGWLGTERELCVLSRGMADAGHGKDGLGMYEAVELLWLPLEVGFPTCN